MVGSQTGKRPAIHSDLAGSSRSRVVSPPKKARPVAPNVLLVGFTAKEKADILKSFTCTPTFNLNLSSEITHIVVKPEICKKDKSFRWQSLYYAVISGSWLLREKWITDSKAKGVLQPESSYVFKASDIDISFGTTKENISLKEIVDLHSYYFKMIRDGSTQIFSNAIFAKTLILCGKSAASKQKQSDLRSIIEAGGGRIVVDDVFRQIREKSDKAQENVSSIFLINADTLEDIGIDAEFIRRILNCRVPILFEEFLTKAIRQKEVVLDRNLILLQSAVYWKYEHKPTVKFSESAYNWIVSGEGSAETFKSSSRSSSVARQTGRSSQPMEYEVDDELGVKLDDFENEMAEKSHLPANEDAHVEPLEYGDTSFLSPIAGSSSAIDGLGGELDFGLGFMDLQTDDLSQIEAAPTISRSWSDTRSELKLYIRAALQKTGFESSRQSEESRSVFMNDAAIMRKNEPGSEVHDLVCLRSSDFIRNSMQNTFLPRSEVVSLLLHDIAMPEYGLRFDAPNAAYRTLNGLLQQFPPTTCGGRYYWLKVFSKPSSSPQMKGRHSLSDEAQLEQRVLGFRKKMTDTFSGTGTNSNLMDILLQLLEMDLYALQGCGGLDESQEVSPHVEEETRRLSIGNRSMVNNSGSDLEGIPLAYLVFYNRGETRKRGLDPNATRICKDVVDFMTKNQDDAIVVKQCARFLCVCLEALRWYLSEALKMFRGDLPHDLRQDLENLLRHFIKNDWNKDELKALLPMSFVSNLIDSLT